MKRLFALALFVSFMLSVVGVAEARVKRTGILITGLATAIDGDTIAIRSEHFRLWGVDAPNAGRVCRRKGDDWKPWGEARDALLQCIKSQVVSCLTQKWEGSRKRYIAQCWNRDGEDLAACMIRHGWGVDYTCYSAGHYLPLEAELRKKETGLWACDGGPKPPLIKRWGEKGQGVNCDKRMYKPKITPNDSR